VLPAPIPGQCFEPIARRHPKVVEGPSIVDQTQLSQRDPLDIRWKPPAASTIPDGLGFAIAEGYDHREAYNAERYTLQRLRSAAPQEHSAAPGVFLQSNGGAHMVAPVMIKEHMEVLGSDGVHVGTVDHLEGRDQVKLTKDDPDAGGEHHFIPLAWVDHVDEHVHLKQSGAEAKARWKTH
jgi:hypothetical protein